MRLFIDCEWNSYKGELLSFALVSEDGQAFYMLLPEPSEAIDPWVLDHVIPQIEQRSPLAPDSFYEASICLADYLAQWPDGVHIVADWPEDIAMFCSLLIIGPGERINTPPLTMEVVRIDAVSKLPHHALYDAEALRDAVLKGEER